MVEKGFFAGKLGVWVSGSSLWTGRLCRVFLTNNTTSRNHCFYNNNLNEIWSWGDLGSVELSCRRRTEILGDDFKIIMPEHFASVLALVKSNVDIYLLDEEFPVGNGSADFWLQALKELGVCWQVSLYPLDGFNEEILPKKQSGGRDFFLRAQSADCLEIVWQAGWGQGRLKLLPENVLNEQNDFAKLPQFWSAPTFIPQRDWLQSRRLGVLWHALPGQGQVVKPEEFKKPEVQTMALNHKILDLLGDIALAGKGLPALRIEVRMGGHWLNQQLTKRIFNYVHTRQTTKT